MLMLNGLFIFYIEGCAYLEPRVRAIIAQHTVHCKGHMIVLAKDILKLEKITLKVGKN